VSTATVPPLIQARSRSKYVYFLLSIAIAGVLLYFSLRGIDWERVWVLMSGAQLSDASLLVALFSIALFLRAVRWRVLLLAESSVRLGSAFYATSAGYLANNVLPARAGELVRTMMVSRYAQVSRTFVLTTAFLERVADAIALVTISGVVLALFTNGPHWLSRAATPIACAGFAALVAIMILPRSHGLLLLLLKKLPLGRLHDTGEHVLRQIINGVGSFHDAGRLTRFVLLTGVIWFLDAASAVVGARAIGLTIAFPLAMLLIAGLGLGSALPSTPGYVGIFQFVAVSILTPSGLGRSEAIAYILFWQAVSYLVYGFWGTIALVRDRMLRVA
jgi:uncharacterized protein (TIRG00374 family)